MFTEQPMAGPTPARTSEPGRGAGTVASVQPSFCIVLPVYNESQGIERCVRDIAAYLATIDARTGIITVDDGSTDTSLEILKRLATSIPNLIVHSHEQNQGYGGANRTGCRLAKQHGFDYGLVMDADGTQGVQFIGRFLEPMRRGVDFIKATRYAKGGRVEGVHWKRKLVSRVGNKLAQWLMGVPLTDFTNGFRAIRTEVWSRLATTERNFAMLIEEVHLAKKLRVTFDDVPYVLTARPKNGGASKFVYSWRVYKRYAQYLFKR
jgi:dolichol-phosphate mannosyltransferase